MIWLSINRTLWKSPLLKLFPKGENAEFFIANPKKIFEDSVQLLSLFDKTMKIKTSKELHQHLIWRIDSGVREEFDKLQQEVEWLTETERIHRMEAEVFETPRRKRRVANQYVHRLPEGGVAALDATYTVFLSIAGKRLNWLTAREARNWIGRAEHLARCRYGNWYDYCTGYNAGVDFISSTEPEVIKEREQRLRRLLNISGSPLKEEFFLSTYRRQRGQS